MDHRGRSTSLRPRRQLGHAGVERGVFAHDRASRRPRPIDSSTVAAHAQGQRARVGVDLDVPGLRAFLPPVEIGGDAAARRPGARRSGCRGWRGTPARRRSGAPAPGRISVRIDSALMPGSKTPMPPGSNTQSCPGCQRRTSSRQVMWARVTVLPPARPCRRDRMRHAANARWRTGDARAFARPLQRVHLGQRRAGGFSSITWRPGAQRRLGIVKARLRRQAERDDLDVGPAASISPSR
jgi:hypothetical protein